MSLRSRALLAFTVGLLTIGPALTLPTVSAHSPTWTAASHPAPHAPDRSRSLPLALPLLGTIKVKDVTAAAAKFKTRAQAAQGDYGKGVANAGGDWEAASTRSEDLYKAAVMEAASKGRYGAGVRGSAAKYQTNATTLGPQRYQQGIGNAEGAYAAGMGPVLQTIAGLTLPPRGLPGTNGERSNIVAVALRKLKVGG